MDSPLALHRSRQRLIDELAMRIDRTHRNEVLLVFDAKNPRGYSTPEVETKGFNIEFAREYEDADTMVIELLQHHSQPKQLTVVSNDHRIQTAASRRDAMAIDADVWFDRLDRSDVAQSSNLDPRKPGVSLTQAETDQLVKEFSDIDLEGPGGSNKSEDTESDSPYNPFPDGYGEDLLDP